MLKIVDFFFRIFLACRAQLYHIVVVVVVECIAGGLSLSLHPHQGVIDGFGVRVSKFLQENSTPAHTCTLREGHTLHLQHENRKRSKNNSRPRTCNFDARSRTSWPPRSSGVSSLAIITEASMTVFFSRLDGLVWVLGNLK